MRVPGPTPTVSRLQTNLLPHLHAAATGHPFAIFFPPYDDHGIRLAVDTQVITTAASKEASILPTVQPFQPLR
jgi:hypothetical protein